MTALQSRICDERLANYDNLRTFMKTLNMKSLTICAILLMIAAVSANAQQSRTQNATRSAVYASANGDDSYLLFSGEKYKEGKKYVIVKFWNEKAPLSEKEKEGIAYLKARLPKDVEVIDFQWKDEEDLKAALSKYNFSVKVSNEKHINLKGDHFSLNTTSGNALFVVEDGKPVSLCSGKDCETKLKFYFRLQSRD